MTELQRPVAAIYVRVSTEDQASQGLSIPAQIETLRQYCQAYGVSIFRIYEDPGISGKDTVNRPALNSLLRDSQSFLFNMVLVWKISRLSRNLKDLLYLIDIFEKQKITFTSYSEKFDTSTPVGKMTLQLLGSIAEFERNTIVENVKLGLGEYARRGGKTGSVLGYRTVDKRLVVDEREAGIVSTIFDLYVNKGLNYSCIARQLNCMGYKTKHGKQFRGDGISLILENPVYIGINRHHPKTDYAYEIKGNHIPIIPEDVWKAAQELKRENRKTPMAKAGQQRRMPGGMIQCPICRQPLLKYYSSAKGRQYLYYRCSKHPGRSFYYNAGKIDRIVMAYVRALMADPMVMQDLKKAFFEKMTRLGTTKEASSRLIESEKNEVQQLLNKYLSLLENELINDSTTVNGRIMELGCMINELESRLGKLKMLESNAFDKSSKSFEDLLSDFLEGIEEMEGSRLYSLAAAFMESLVPDKDAANISIYFSFPVRFE